MSPSMRALMLVLVLALSSLSGCGGDDEPGVRESSVEEVVEEASRLERVSVRGTAYPVADVGFVLSGQKDSVWVLAPAERVRELEPSEDVRVTGEVLRLQPDQAVRLAGVVADAKPLASDVTALRRIVRARRNEGVAYIEAREIDRDELGEEG